MVLIGRCKTNYIPMGHKKFKPVENKTSVNFDLSKFVSYGSKKQEAQGLILG